MANMLDLLGGTFIYLLNTYLKEEAGKTKPYLGTLGSILIWIYDFD